MRMPFGKYRNVPLEEVPDGYLLWLLDNCQQLSPTLREAMEERLGLNQRRRAAPVPNWEEVVRAWYQQMALAFGPECGGSDEALRVVEEGYARLCRLVGLWPW